jgi:hypothetical protein
MVKFAVFKRKIKIQNQEFDLKMLNLAGISLE